MKLGPLVIITVLVVSISSVSAQEKSKDKEKLEGLVAGLKFQQGEINLKKGLATLKVPNDLRFLSGHDAVTVLVHLWANPSMDEPLGLIMPAAVGPLDPESWAVIVTYEEDGYVKDHDAETIDYADLLKKMQKDVRDENKERQRQGFDPVELIGWAEPPHYDQAVHKLYWAKELKFGDSKYNTLNYNIRILGRRGLLVLNAVAAMPQLPEIQQASPEILGAIDFSSGHRYADFSEANGDKVASYGIAALVAGGVAAKLGFFKGLWVLILGAKKFVVIGVVAMVAWFKRLFGKKEAT